MRVACVFVPDFRLQARLRARPDLRGRPIVPVAQACALRPDVEPLPPSRADERAARAALLDVADAHSPEVEDAAPGCVFLTIDARDATSLAAAVARVGLCARVAVAATKECAAALARVREGVTVVPQGGEREALATLPVGALDPSPDLARTLARLGLRTLGQIAAISTAAAAAYLGPEGARAVRVARGEPVEPLRPRPAPLVFEEAVDLDFGAELHALEPLAFVLRGMCDRLAARLALGHLGARALKLRLQTEAGRCEREIALAAPTREACVWLRLLRLRLEADPPPAPVAGIALLAEPARVRPVQASLFEPPGPRPEALAVAVARLGAMGVAVETPAVPDAHRVGSTVRGLAFRPFRPPRAAEVLMDRGEPAFVRAPGIGGRVVRFAGPWRLDAEWWADGPKVAADSLRGDRGGTGGIGGADPDRREGEHRTGPPMNEDLYDAELSDGGVYVIGAGRGGEWRVWGLYD